MPKLYLTLCGLVLGVSALSIPASAAQDISVFQIGNSLTNDSLPSVAHLMPAALGVNWTPGYHIRSASSLREIWDNPTNYHASSPGPTYVEGLSNSDWDVLVLQPYNRSGNTMAHDIQYMKQFIDVSKAEGRNADTRYFVYTSWPQSNQWGNWLSPVSDSLTQLTIHRQQYYQHLAERISDEVDRTVYLIPVGEVLHRVREEWQAGNLPELGNFSTEVYRDLIHMSYGKGRFIASSTVLSTVLGVDPTGIAVPPHFGGVSPTLAAQLQSIIWDVVANNPYTGVIGPRKGDVNGDGDVDSLDLAIWAHDFVNQPVLRADANGDLRVDELDLVYWQNSLVPAPAEAASNFNGDLFVNELDRQIWASNFGSTAPAGDANGDGQVNAGDYVIWRNAVAIQQERFKADFNNDGFVNQLDRDIWEQENGLFWELRADWSGNKILDYDDILVWEENFHDFSARLVGDYDQNGVVDLNDHAVWQQTLGSRYLLNADGNGDGEVNQADYNVWLSFYSQGSGGVTAAVPEPAGIALTPFLAVMALAFIRWCEQN